MKRVLIVFNPYFIPSMGHNRMLRIFRQLPRLGYEAVMLTEPCRSELYRGELPDERSEQVGYLDLQQLYARLRGGSDFVSADAKASRSKPVSRPTGLTTFINRWLMIPDKQILWAGPAVRSARKRAARESIDLVFASNLPATNGIVGARLASSLKIPLVLEYRDLWTGSPYHNMSQPTALHRALHSHLERRILRQAARVTCLSSGIAACLQQLYAPVLPVAPAVNYNFFDPDEFSAAGPEPQKPEAFTISYVGTMYMSRNPAMFFQGLRRFIDRNGITPAQFRFRWLGTVVGIEGLQEMIRANGVEPFIDFLGQIPHRDALNELRRSHVSLIIQSPDDAIHIPGKLFETMGARVPLLAVANPCEVTNIIDRTNSGIHCPYEADAVASAIEKMWTHVCSGSPWPFAESEVEQFSIANAVGKLAALFDDAIASR